jgi:arsenite methyltransferase
MKRKIKSEVKKVYGKIARTESSCCSPACGGKRNTAENISGLIGYSQAEMRAVPEGANLGLGCGNPLAISSIRKGETVLDLGSGAGFDAFLAAKKVGASGRVIGVDMTEDMIKKARANATKGKYQNVEFRLGEIENLPVDDASVDLIISNCVINLVPDKEKAFKEAYRVLKPGGRLAISDLVLSKDLPKAVRDSVAAYTSCVAGAIRKEAYLDAITKAGFGRIKIQREAKYPLEAFVSEETAKLVMKDLDLTRKDLTDLEGAVLSIAVEAKK